MQIWPAIEEGNSVIYCPAVLLAKNYSRYRRISIGLYNTMRIK